MNSSNTYVFGYGSLVEYFQAHAPSSLQSTTLSGFRREWSAAMDNMVDIPGYRYFVETTTKLRPEVFVTFLNIRADNNATTNGLLIPVSNSDIPRIDRRERNYNRINVTRNIEPRPDSSTIYAYIGKPEAHLRFEHGKRRNQAVISKQYLEKVTSSFAKVGEQSLASFQANTARHNLPVMDLTEIKLD